MRSETANRSAVQPEPGEGRPQRTALTYVLITPARNEAAFIEQTIKSVVAQTTRPAKWVIVSDGSTDGTDEIVKAYAAQYEWIELLRMPERKERHFAGKAHAFNAGCGRIKDTAYDLIGNLDADITFEADYFPFLLDRFAENPRLGVAGTPFREDGRQYDYRFTSIEHVSGACQLFRRECFEAIGGYRPIKTGGIDFIAVTTARMKGWQTRTFREETSVHHRKQGSAKRGALAAAFALGQVDYTHGSDILWQLCRSVYQTSRSPTGILYLAGYVWALTTRAERVIPPEIVRFIKSEQRSRLREFIGQRFTLGRGPPATPADPLWDRIRDGVK
ncbi:MAG: glycosyltransferase family 2 protein [Terriglobia bacterium]